MKNNIANQKFIHKYKKRLIALFLILSMVLAYGLWNGLLNAHAYSTENPGVSRSYANGYLWIYMKGPSGTSSMQLKFVCNGSSSISAGTFNNISRKETISVNSISNPNPYNLGLVTTSTATKTNYLDNYTNVEFYIKYTKPAHEQYSWVSMDFPSFSGMSSDFNSSTASHNSSSSTVNLFIDTSVYCIGQSTRDGYRYFNSSYNFNLQRSSRTVTYNGNGGNSSEGSRNVTDGYQFGDLPTASRYGYNFQGWSTSNSGSVNISKYTTTCYDMTVYAVWDPWRHTVSYNPNGGNGTLSDQTKTYGVTFTIPSEKPTKKGYALKEWNTNANGTGTAYSPGGNYTPDQNGGTVTLYAIWVRSDYDVIFHSNGSSDSDKTSILKYGQNDDLPANTFKRSGYTFMGWSEDESSKKVKYKDNESVYNLAGDDEGTELYAVWKKTDGTFDTTNIVQDENMFMGDIDLTGQNGTIYGAQNNDSTYAKIDKDKKQGYFSLWDWYK